MFKVYKQAIDLFLIDEVLISHEHFKKSSRAIFRAQGTTAFEKPILNKYGNQINSIHNPHLLGLLPRFRKSIESLILYSSLSNYLHDFTGEEEHVWWQSMFFDKSTSTTIHQDTWYLDTYPKGSLVGIWIALEDIDINSGPFYVYKSQNKEINKNNYNNPDLEKDKNFKKNFPIEDKFIFNASKGDILIWDSYALHGAMSALNENATRKSLTAHFYPYGMKAQEAPYKRIFSIYNHKKPKATSNSCIKSAATINPILYQLLCIILFKINKWKFLKWILMKERKENSISEIRNI